MEYVWIFNRGKMGKVWGYTSYNNEGNYTVIFWWGSIGRRMDQLTSKTIVFPNRLQAIHDVTTKIDDKERKGYRKMPNGSYFDFVHDFQTKVDDWIEEAALPC